jgi:hypothetical protein
LSADFEEVVFSAHGEFVMVSDFVNRLEPLVPIIGLRPVLMALLANMESHEDMEFATIMLENEAGAKDLNITSLTKPSEGQDV